MSASFQIRDIWFKKKGLKMDSILLLFIVLCYIHVVVSATTTYNCNRDGQNCKHSAKCLNGVCDCASLTPEPYGGYDCTYKISDKAKGGCGGSNPYDCGPNAQCYDEGTGPRCFCDVGFIKDEADRCIVPRYRVECGLDSMTIILIPAGDFKGEIYMLGHPNCSFSNVDSTYTKTNVPNISPECGNAVTETLANGRTIVRRQVRVEYSTIYTTSHDETVNVECNMTDTFQLETNFSSIHTNTNDMTNITGSNPPDIVSLKVTDENGNPVSSETLINLGDILTFTLFVDPSVFRGVALLWMTVDNNLPLPNLISTELIDKGCVAPRIKLIVPPGPVHPTNIFSEISVKFRTIVYKTTSNIRLRFRCKVCLIPDTNCDTQCFLRRKRSISEEEKTKDIDFVLNIKSPYTAKDLTTTTRQTESKSVCVHTTEMVAAVASLSVLVFILLLVALILLFRVFRSNDNRRKIG